METILPTAAFQSVLSSEEVAGLSPAVFVFTGVIIMTSTVPGSSILSGLCYMCLINPLTQKKSWECSDLGSLASGSRSAELHRGLCWGQGGVGMDGEGALGGILFLVQRRDSLDGADEV